jgi:TolB-like protein/DNA-binding winged helix-turn-helix (wHTH) protein
MNRSTTQAELVRVGDFELNVRTGELFPVDSASAAVGSAKTLLREQPFQILRILVERHGDIVTRQEIRQILWPNDTVVEFDRSINVAMAILRKALADDADHPKYIETLARRGYRLIAPVEWQPNSRGDTPAGIEGKTSEHEPGPRKYSRKAAVVVVSAVVFAVIGYVSWRQLRDVTPQSSNRIMLAVLPFENLTGDPNKEYLADGLTEQTISQLGRLNPKELGVIARTSVMGYKHKDERLDQIGKDLSVQYILENSLRQSGGLLRVTSQLIRVKDQSHLWSHDYDYRAQDVLTVEDELAKAVANEIQVRFAVQQQGQLPPPHPVNPEAFQAYLQGYYFWEKNTDQDTEMAGKYFERAIQLDSSYALAWAALSRVRKWQASRGLIPPEGYRIAREEVQRALALNPNLAAAHLQMGRIQQQVDFDWTAADASFKRAVELEPGNAEAIATAASCAKLVGRFDEALRLNRRAVKLDPLNAGVWDALAETEYMAGQLDEAAAHGKKALELSPDVFPGSILLSQIYVMQGRLQDALPEIERVRIDGTRTFLQAIAYFALGRKKDSDAALSELIAKYPRDTYYIAQVYAFRGQSNEALDWLDRAYAERNSGLIGVKSATEKPARRPAIRRLIEEAQLPRLK